MTDVAVLEGNTPYKLVRSETEGGYTAVTSGGKLTLEWWYPYTSNASRTFTLKYTVRGGLRIYDGGDQLWWVAVFPDRQKAVRSSTVTVRLPAGMDPAAFKTESYFTKAEARVVDARTVVFTSGTVAANTPLEIRVQFPHGVVKASVPAWQAKADADAGARGRLQPWKDLFNLVGILLTLFIPLLTGPGPLPGLVHEGQGQAGGLVADYLAQPPSDLPAGVVGTLMDESADMKDIIASILDLARRGVIKITDTTNKGFFGASHSFTFSWQGAADPGAADLREYACWAASSAGCPRCPWTT